MGLERSNGDNLARAQTNAEIDHPDQAVAEGGVAQGSSSQRTSGFEPPDRESAHPVDDGLGTRGFLHTEFGAQESQDATDGAKADAHRSKELQAEPNDIDLRPHGHGLSVVLKLAQAALGRFEVLLGLIMLGFDAGELLAQVTVVIAALLGFGLPLVAAVFELRKLTHRLAGEHGRFCSDAKAPCCEQWMCCDTAFFWFRGGGRCQVEHERLSPALFLL